jgi:hypothetical protein
MNDQPLLKNDGQRGESRGYLERRGTAIPWVVMDNS